MAGSKLAMGGAEKATVARRPDDEKNDDERLSASVVLEVSAVVELMTSPLACCV